MKTDQTIIDWLREKRKLDRIKRAAPDLLAALKSLVNMQKGREDWPEVLAAEAAIAKAEGAVR